MAASFNCETRSDSLFNIWDSMDLLRVGDPGEENVLLEYTCLIGVVVMFVTVGEVNVVSETAGETDVNVIDAGSEESVVTGIGVDSVSVYETCVEVTVVAGVVVECVGETDVGLLLSMSETGDTEAMTVVDTGVGILLTSLGLCMV